MERTYVVIEHDNGNIDEVLLRPVSLVAAERHFKGTVPPVEGTLWAAWYTLHQPGGTFADWLEGIERIEETTAPPSLAKPATP
jgi:hypothetical protein